ncbi:hypothetical protein EIP86_008725 [Pleurotus ostreatoroseus]|nr:hypothetical protein EIP86_008725 [Pleurotus ostreatoroseus]
MKANTMSEMRRTVGSSIGVMGAQKRVIHQQSHVVMGSADDAEDVEAAGFASDVESSNPDHEGNGGVSGASKPGRKKNPNSQAARRDQNRIAQREFRLRKQQRIRDLEASVEILSGGKDEAVTQLRKIMKDLMQENQVLRQLLRSLSNFIGDGAGGLLPKLGWDLNDFNNFVNRSETDTAWESYQRHKRDEGGAPAANAAPGGTPGSSSAGAGKRPSEDDGPISRTKRARVPGEQNGEGDRDGYPLLVPVNPSVPPLPANGLYPTPTRSHDGNFLNDLMRPSGSSMYMPPASPANSSSFSSAPASAANHSPYQTSYMPPMNVNVDTSLPGLALVSNAVSMPAPRAVSAGSSQAPKPPPQTASPAEDDQDPKRHEAYKLIQYGDSTVVFPLV